MIQLIGCHYDSNDKLIGLRLLDTEPKNMSDAVKDFPINNILTGLSKGASVNGLKLVGKKLQGSNGAISRYPKFVGGKLVEPKLMILASIDDIGFVVTDPNGNINQFTENELIEKLRQLTNGDYKNLIANGKFVERNGKEIISSINGVYGNLPVEKSSLKKVENTVNKEKAQLDTKNASDKEENADRKEYLNNKATAGYGNNPAVPRFISGGERARNSKRGEMDEKSGLTVDQKLSYALLAVREIRPIYFTFLNILKRVEAIPEDGIDTMAVSINALYFSPDFIKDTELSELIFILLHEVGHIAMKHRSRENGRNHKLWNIACDYYINKALGVDLKLSDVGVKREVASLVGSNKKYNVQIPTNCLYNDNIDIDKDTPEKLYNELNEAIQGQQKKQQSQGQGQGQGQQSQGQGQQSQGQGQGQQSQGQGQQSQGQGQQSQGQGQQSQGQGQQSKGQGQGQGQQSQGQGVVDIDFRGQALRIDLSGSDGSGSAGNSASGQSDMVDDPENQGLTTGQMEAKANQILGQVSQMHKRMFSNVDAGGFIERFIEAELAPKVNWKHLVRKYLVANAQKEYSFSHPDKRFLGNVKRGQPHQVFAGPFEQEGGALKNIKVCVDTSGSISDGDLGTAFAQLKDLMKKYKAEAELLYWDTDVRATYKFTNMDELLKCKPMGGGGTDCNCVFRTFEEGDYAKHKKPKPSLIIVFTDGCFGEIEQKYKKYKNTIWVIFQDSLDHFEAPFGVVAKYKDGV